MSSSSIRGPIIFLTFSCSLHIKEASFCYFGYLFQILVHSESVVVVVVIFGMCCKFIFFVLADSGCLLVFCYSKTLFPFLHLSFLSLSLWESSLCNRTVLVRCLLFFLFVVLFFVWSFIISIFKVSQAKTVFPSRISIHGILPILSLSLLK